METKPPNLPRKITKLVNYFLCLFPPLFALLLYFLADYQTGLYAITITLFILILLNLQNRSSVIIQFGVFKQNAKIKILVGFMIIFIRICFTLLLFLNNHCSNCIFYRRLFPTNFQGVLQAFIIVVIKPVLVDLFYNFVLFPRLKLGEYNKYFTFLTCLFYEVFDLLLMYDFEKNLNIFLVETIWIFYISHIGKFQIFNSTFLKVAGMVSHVSIVVLMRTGILNVNNNFELNFYN